MSTDNQRFKKPALAREYIRNLANQFAEPEQMLEFLSACEVAQAALAELLFKEHRIYCLQKAQYLRGVRTERESQVELEVAWNEFRQASKEFDLAKETLKNIIAQLAAENLFGSIRDELG